MPTRPRNVSSRSTSSALGRALEGGVAARGCRATASSSRRATASTRSDACAHALGLGEDRRRGRRRRARATPVVGAARTQRGRRTSTLPFTCAISRPCSSSVTTVMRLRSLSNGSSCTTWCEGAIDSRGRAALRGEREERALGRIADDASSASSSVDVELRVVAERGRRERVRAAALGSVVDRLRRRRRRMSPVGS